MSFVVGSMSRQIILARDGSGRKKSKKVRAKNSVRTTVRNLIGTNGNGTGKETGKASLA
jgi:hypothetical protein